MPSNRLVIALAALCLAGMGATGAHAGNLITNGSFENTTGFVGNGDDTMTLGPGSTTMQGWTVTTNDLAWIGPTNDFNLTASNGGYFLDLTGYSDNAPYGTVTQTITTTPGARYALTFDLGSSAEYGLPDAITASAGATSQTFTSSSPGLNQWQTETLDFTAGGPSTVITLAGASGQYYIGLDNVSVDGVPEPASWALLVSGVAMVGAGLRMNRRGAARALAA